MFEDVFVLLYAHETLPQLKYNGSNFLQVLLFSSTVPRLVSNDLLGDLIPRYGHFPFLYGWVGLGACLQTYKGVALRPLQGDEEERRI